MIVEPHAWNVVPCLGCGYDIAYFKLSGDRHWHSVLDTCTCEPHDEQPAGVVDRLAKIVVPETGPRTLIVAVSENGVIGQNGRLPWHLPADLKRFKRLTKGHAVVMGRKTWESIEKRPLPKRLNLVVTRNPDYTAKGAVVASSLGAALSLVPADKEAFIIGGEAIYREGFAYVDRIQLTRVHTEVEGDAHFPLEALEEAWILVADDRREPDEKHAYAFSFQVFVRDLEDDSA